MFKEWLALNEMPIVQLNKVGDWSKGSKKYGYSDKDIGIIGNENATAKIIKKWNNTKQDYILYFVKLPKVHQFVEIGEVSQEWVKEKLKLDIKPTEDAITIIFTNNKGDEKVPLTSWIIAHRLSHAIRRIKTFETYFTSKITRDFKKIIQDAYGYSLNLDYFSNVEDFKNSRKVLVNFMQAIGSMKSARDGNLRNDMEFFHELLAQYLITGKIKFNPLPSFIQLDNKKMYGHDISRKIYKKNNSSDDVLESLSDEFEYAIDAVLDSVVNKIFVM